MRSPAIVSALAALVVALPSAASAQMPPEAPDPSIADGTAQQALDAARQRWAATGLADYRFRVRILCFCPETYTVPRRITVHGGRARKPPPHLKHVATVPKLFGVVQGAIDAGVASLTVSYGAQGLVRSLSIDESRMIADEEVSYRASRLRPLP